MDNANIVKRPVTGNLAKKCVLLFAALIVLITAIGGFLLWRFPAPGNQTAIPLIVLLFADALLAALAVILPRMVYYSAYTYSLSGEGITLWRKNEAVMSLSWAETEVSLGSYIWRGSENNPSVCKKALCFTRKGKMRNPPRFPKRALKGAAGELCIAYSKARLREVCLACGGDIAGDVTPDGLRLSASDTEQMTGALSKARAWAKKKAAGDAAKAAAETRRQARKEVKQPQREKEDAEAAPEAELTEAQTEADAALPSPAPVQERETVSPRNSLMDVDSLGDDEEFL